MKTNWLVGWVVLTAATFLLPGCSEKADEEPASGINSVEHYRLINPNNLYYKCNGDLILDYANYEYSILYDISCIFKKDTTKFYLSESGTFSDAYQLVPTDFPEDGDLFYYAGKLSFTSTGSVQWGCTYQLSDSTAFKHTFLNPSPRMIMFKPVYNKKVVTHILDSVQPGLIKPWIEVVTVKAEVCDTMQLFWR